MQNSILPVQKQKELLKLEYEAQKEEFQRQTERMGIHRKINRGICWYPVEAGRSYYNSLNQFVVEIIQTEPNDIEHHFEYDRPISFFNITDEGKLYYFEQTCRVSYADETKMVVSIPDVHMLTELQKAKQLGVQLYFDETSFKIMFNALEEVIKAKKNRLEDLRDMFAGLSQPQKYTFYPIGMPWLNKTQEKAVNEVLWAKDVAIVHGPPGTGKTTTLVEAIYETLRRETQVMVCAQSNTAVDWISEKLVDRGIPVLRIGNPTRVNDKMLSFTYERKFESHPDYPELWNIRRTIREIRSKKNSGDKSHQKISRLRDRASEIEIRIKHALFDEARVVACTLVGAANKILVGHRFSTLFIDEAAQALEAACWVAIRRADRVILAGDHQQLPPTVKCYEALRHGLGKTLMERIACNQPDTVTLLKIQYRMNEAIMRFSSDWFYHGMVESSAEVKNRSILDFDTPMMWVDTSNENIQKLYEESQKTTTEEPATGNTSDLSISKEDYIFQEQFVGENHGRINKQEAELTIKVLEEYIEKIGRQRFIDERLDVGIISPYKIQTQYLRNLVRKNDFLKPLRENISINTVDGFQGQERDIILISLVRSNEEGQIGFLNDLRRMNVAMTRARMKLIVIGNSQTLSHHHFYKKLKEYIDSLTEN
ncbi:MAG: AAA domain-containing protein [Bacteroides sp.]|nr:AAA domain-containing protein [Roseburia sp.]MCM1345462.1 AAA domain-containing protein [Bacteroides sp.]MCM1421800.1 AAA domain-containing protein [Bacteroides sp.]